MRHVNELAAGSDMVDEDLFIIEAIETVDKVQNKKEIHCTTKINGHEVQLKIDTGAKCNVMIYFEN